MPRIEAICVSEKKGVQKKPVKSAAVVADFGIAGDAHAGNWHRQISLLAKESTAKMQEKLRFELSPGDFAENILTEGIEVAKLLVGTRLRLGGEVLCEITQIGKECHADCVIRRLAGDCVMPKEGVFARIIRGGEIREGDEIMVMG